MKSLKKMIDLPKINDPRGNLTFIEGQKHIPFDVKRVYYLYDVPSGASRGGHAHIKLQQAVIALAGSFEFILDDGMGHRETVFLNSPSKALIIDNSTWREMENFSSGAVCLVLASERFEESDYIRDFDIFVKHVQKNLKAGG